MRAGEKGTNLEKTRSESPSLCEHLGKIGTRQGSSVQWALLFCGMTRARHCVHVPL